MTALGGISDGRTYPDRMETGDESAQRTCVRATAGHLARSISSPPRRQSAAPVNWPTSTTTPTPVTYVCGDQR